MSTKIRIGFVHLYDMTERNVHFFSFSFKLILIEAIYYI